MSFQEIDDALNEAINPPEPEPEVVEESDGNGTDNGTESVDSQELILGKFKDHDELGRGYQEAERAMRQAQEEAAQYRAQLEEFEQAQQQPAAEPVDPWGYLGTPLDEDTANQIYGKVLQDPQGTMEWAMHPDVQRQFGADIGDRVYATWLGIRPLAAQSWHANHVATTQRQEVEQLRNEWEQDKQREQEARAERDATSAREQLQQIPDFEQHRDRVVQLMGLMPLANDHPMNQSADGVAQYTRMLLGIARDEAFQRAQAENPTQQASAAPQAAKARTQQRSTAGAQAQQAAHPDDQAMLDSLAAQIQSGDY
jgi:hypothetical protein